jgi:hypothetical protein
VICIVHGYGGHYTAYRHMLLMLFPYATVPALSSLVRQWSVEPRASAGCLRVFPVQKPPSAKKGLGLFLPGNFSPVVQNSPVMAVSPQQALYACPVERTGSFHVQPSNIIELYPVNNGK